MTSPLIAASILSADFSALGADIKAVDNAGSDWIHVDVMDGNYVPNLSFGAPVIKSVRGFSKKPFDVHLMVTDTEVLIDGFIVAGADFISFHPDAEDDPWRIIKKLQAKNIPVGIALNPEIPLTVAEEFIPVMDLLLIMTVQAGFGGQSFMADLTDKIKAASEMIKASGRDIHLQVDGGINAETAAIVRNAGANVLVAGSAVFNGGKDCYAENIKILKG